MDCSRSGRGRRVIDLLYVTTSYDATLLDRVHEEFLLRWLDLGHQATILVPDPRRDRESGWTCEPGRLPVVRPAVSRTRAQRVTNWLSRRLLHYDSFFNLLRAYLRFLREHPEIDLIHIESVYPLGAIAAVASVLDRRPFVPTIRGGDLIADDDSGYGFARFRIVRVLLRLTFARAAVVRALSPTADAMARRYGCPPGKLMTIPRNIRDEYFVPDPAAFRAAQRAWLRDRHPEIGERQVIVAAGRLLPVKGFDDLVRAMSALPDAVALICGPNRQDERVGDYATYLTTLATERGIQNRIVLVGAVARAEMPRYFAGGDVLAVPSLMEGGNRTVLEAAALGIPFVATETSGTPAFFTSAEGLAIPPRRPDLLAAGLARLLAESAAERKARQIACHNAAQRFMSGPVAQAMEDLYRRVLATARA